MKSKLEFKIELQYFINNKKVIFTNTISNDGLATKSICVGNNKVIEKTIKDRVLSGECLFEGITYGYAYIYDQEGITIDLKQKNESISISESVNKINEVKKSKEFDKANMDGILTITNSPEFIYTPSKSFTVYEEVSQIDDEKTFFYSLKKNFTCLDEKLSIIECEEEKYQINNDYVSIITELQNNTKTVHSNIQTNEKEVQSIIEQLQPLKELLRSSPRSYKNLKIENNTKKTIR